MSDGSRANWKKKIYLTDCVFVSDTDLDQSELIIAVDWNRRLR